MRMSFLREFVVLSKHLNFSLAARYLNMTQPGLSRHISKLEDEIGFKLFKRDTQKVRLTKEGETFLHGVRKILADWDFLCESIPAGGLKKITIGVPYYGINKYLSGIIQSFESSHAGVKIDYLPSYPDEIITGLLAMTVDVAILPKVDFLNSEKLVFHDAFNEPVVLMLNRNHRLAAGTGVKLCDLENENLIFLKGNWGNAVYEHVCDFCRHQGFEPPGKERETDTIEAAALYMSPEKGMMLLPRHLRESNISGNVKCVNILDRDFYMTVSLVRHPENKNPVVSSFIREYLRQVRQDKKRRAPDYF